MRARDRGASITPLCCLLAVMPRVRGGLLLRLLYSPSSERRSGRPPRESHNAAGIAKSSPPSQSRPQTYTQLVIPSPHTHPPCSQEIASLKTNTTKQWRGNKCMEPRDCTVEDHTHNEPVEHNRENIGHVHAPFQRDTPGVQGGSLLQGTYDEEASSASFQEALREWRAAAGHDSRDNQEQQTILVRGIHVLVCVCVLLLH